MSIIRLDQLDPQQISAGGKARSLAQMMRLGLPVPAGFVLLPTAFVSGSMAPASASAMRDVLAQLWPNQLSLRLAVRSSGVAEDSTAASFAGEFDTRLNVTPAELSDAIAAVYASQDSERIRSYRAAQGLAKSELAIVVQEMVTAELAGILFTVDPVHGKLDAMPGSAIAGLGEALVSGESTGVPFQLARSRGKLSSQAPLPALTTGLARQLYRAATLLEETLGTPQDIEWAIANGKLYLLQTRPITTLQAYDPRDGSYNSSRQGEYLWTSSNFGEAIPDVMTPSTWSIVKIFMQEAMPFDFLDAYPVMGNIGGRFYMNISIMASLFMALGFSRERLNKESEEFFGNIPPEVEIPVLPLPFWATLKRFLPTAIRHARRVVVNRRHVISFAEAMPDLVAHLSAELAHIRQPDALATFWETKLLPPYRRASQLLQAGTSDYENRYRALRTRLLKFCSPEECNTLLTGLNQGDEGLASLGPLLGLAQVQAGTLSQAAYTEQYGHRGPHEYELSWPRPAEDSDWIEAQLASLEGFDPVVLIAQQAARRDAAWQRFTAANPRQSKKIAAELAATAQAGRTREKIRSEMVRAFGLLRQFYLRAATQLNIGADVFFLEYEELLKTLAGKPLDRVQVGRRRESYEMLCQLPTYPGIIVGRFDPVAWAADPKRRLDIVDTRPDGAVLTPASSDPNKLSGFPGAVGEVEGVVRRLDRPEDGHLLQPGEILVTSTTNVGWTPLFPRAGAIVTDVGAPLSHAAIVARELGIPAVVGTGDATRRLRDGETVLVNGGEGWVRRLER